MSPPNRNFDLENRTLLFARTIRDFLKTVPKSEANQIYRKQLLRSSSSVGANYVEANDATGPRDFLVKARTSRREARESTFWLRLLEIPSIEPSVRQHAALLDEAWQLVRIFSAIIRNTEASKIQKSQSDT
jgi:four helix bundle protein